MPRAPFPERIRDWVEFLSKDADWTKTVSEALSSIGFTDEYVESSPKEPQAGRIAAVKDSVWGMIKFDPTIACLIDCPLLQRLRNVSQTGFTSYTYPTARHSRFSHTLGVYHVVRSLIQEFKITLDAQKNYKTLSPLPKAAIFSSKESMLLQRAAILHDIGHGPFSHVTEEYFKQWKGRDNRKNIGTYGLDDFLGDFRHYYFGFVDGTHYITPTGGNKLSEILSIIFITSERFIRFYDNCFGNSTYNGIHDVYNIAALILGDRITKNDVALPSVLSGAIDADKLDYMLRDAKACRISLGIDVARVFLRAGVYSIPKSKDPFKEDIKGLDPNDENIIIFVIDQAGGDTVEEMGASRLSLYRRVYYHSYTRNVEGQFHALLDALGNSNSLYNDILYIWAQDEQSLLINPYQDFDESVKKLAWSIRLRKMPKRAASFSLDSLHGQFRDTVLASHFGNQSKDSITQVLNTLDNRPVAKVAC